MSTISLCMIVKNEKEMLPMCLETTKDWVDEIIVVDTGSTDNTVEIAQSHGATIHHFAWIEDFGAARNFAASKATSDYLLILDADERLAAGAGETIRESIAGLNFDIGLLPLHQAISRHAALEDVVEGDARRGSPILLPRLS